jgi:outer membrane protein OmpA-like peptidoglycan-associated protein
MKNTLLTILFFYIFLQCFSQITINNLEIANKFYKNQDYSSAIYYFEKYLSPYYDDFNNSFNPYSVSVRQSEVKENDNSIITDALYKTAESYRKLNIHDKSAYLYKELLNKKITKYPLLKYYYAFELKFIGQFDESRNNLESFIKEYKKSDQFKSDAQKGLASLNLIKEEMNKKDNKYFLAKPIILESRDTGSHYAPIFLNNDQILLNTTKANYALNKGIYQNRVFLANINGENLSNYLPVQSLIQGELEHQGASSISNDGKELYLTRWSYVNGIKYSQIFISRKTINGWTNPVSFDDLNISNFNSQQPFATQVNGKKTIFFSSDRKGGFGGYDLYAAELNDSGRVVKISNLGNNLNTESDEVSPFYNSQSRTLIFSNNGRIGMGGFDLYETSYPEKDNVVKNLGYPINSIKDDIYFTSRSTSTDFLKDCWVSSDRYSQCCLQAIHIINSKPDYEINGRVINCDSKKTLKDVEIILSDSVGNVKKYFATSNQDGIFKIKVDKFEPFAVLYKLKNHISQSTLIKVPESEEFLITTKDVCLVPLVEKKSIVLDRIYFDYNKADLKSESMLQLDSLVIMLNEYPSMVIEINAHTDSIGTDKYNLDLSEARAFSVLTYLNQKGILKSRLKSRGYGKSLPLEPNSKPDGSDNPEGRARNRRVAFTIQKM